LRVLVLNAGSSSLKAGVIEVGQREPLAAAAVDWGSDATKVTDRRKTLADALAGLAEMTDLAGLAGAGHRVVHGGSRFRQPTLIDDAVLAELDELSELAPLHNPVAVDTIRAARDALPQLPHVAIFDTAFHATLSPSGYLYALPYMWYTKWGIRRYGFHGLSVAWSVRRAGELLGRDPADLGLIVAHLGSGCSVTAVDEGRSVWTSMGLTPLEGLMMGTRAGSFDPGVMLRLLSDDRLSLDELVETLDHGSGLLGVSGVSGDVRDVEAAAASGNERATLALQMFVRRTAGYVAAAATSLRRLDVIVFTGGIGEHAADVRAQIVARLGVLGVGPIGAQAVEEDAILSTPESAVAVVRVEAREDVVIAEAVAEEVRRESRGSPTSG
jgi:acetate kinase